MATGYQCDVPWTCAAIHTHKLGGRSWLVLWKGGTVWARTIQQCLYNVDICGGNDGIYFYVLHGGCCGRPADGPGAMRSLCSSIPRHPHSHGTCLAMGVEKGRADDVFAMFTYAQLVGFWVDVQQPFPWLTTDWARGHRYGTGCTRTEMSTGKKGIRPEALKTDNAQGRWVFIPDDSRFLLREIL